MARALRMFLISFVVALVTVVPAGAQSGIVSGKVTGADGGGPLPGAIVRLETNGFVAAQGKTGSDGSFRITGSSRAAPPELCDTGERHWRAVAT